MGEETRIERAVERALDRKRSRTVETIQQNPLTAILLTLITGGTVSGFGTDTFFGAAAARENANAAIEAAREERDEQVAAVVRAAENTSLQMMARIQSAESERDRAIADRDLYRQDLQACNAARLDDRVSDETEIPPSALEAADGAP